ncbi:MAG: HAD family hydrolase [Xanthomonadaceae bacterium]|nr:HAD family hydrolase [Xanthomonadaceae bacterium]
MQRILLVLDLDETLVFADERPLARAPDLDLPPYAVYLRPWAREFLRHVAVHFELAVWTSSSAAYARALVPVLFDDPSRLAFVWSRERCTLQRDLANDTWVHAKRLAKVKRHGHDLRRTVVVDDSPEKHLRNYGNLVRVAPFLGDPADDELPHLAAWLERLHIEPDVRVVEKRGWRRHVPSPVSFMHAAS